VKLEDHVPNIPDKRKTYLYFHPVDYELLYYRY
jgi:hypothetical protein